jgi:hypothetical protein
MPPPQQKGLRIFSAGLFYFLDTTPTSSGNYCTAIRRGVVSGRFGIAISRTLALRQVNGPHMGRGEPN